MLGKFMGRSFQKYDPPNQSIPFESREPLVTSPEPDSELNAVRVALVHDWLTGMRGGEKVLEILCQLYPHAELFTLVHKPNSVSAVIERHRPHTSIIQSLPNAHKFYRYYLPLFPFAIERFDLNGFDLILSTSHCVAKAVIKTGRTRHLCYCHSPMRYAWDQYDAYFGPERIGALQSQLLRPFFRTLARWDAKTSDRVDRFVANSQHVAARIRRYYNRQAQVIHPPVDVDFFCQDDTVPSKHFLVVSALVPYKRIDVAIQACQSIGAQLKIVGQGPELNRLRKMSGDTVEFLGNCSAEVLRQHYREASAVLLPGEEDFGIVPVEALACGRPVVALAKGGSLETIIDGVSGVLVHDTSISAFADGLLRVSGHSFDSNTIRSKALIFSTDRFIERIRKCVRTTMEVAPENVRW
jgi:glycosyltransferase involved in cell wall biosynthesis